jgi:hypothetical protein
MEAVTEVDETQIGKEAQMKKEIMQLKIRIELIEARLDDLIKILLPLQK